MKRTIITTLTSVAMLAGLGLVTAAPAEATYGNSRPCVTKREWNVADNRIENGWPTRTAIRNIFDTNGTVVLDKVSDYDFYDEETGDSWVFYDARDQFRSYPKCASWGRGRVAVWYIDYAHELGGLRALLALPRAALVPEVFSYWQDMYAFTEEGVFRSSKTPDGLSRVLQK
jgi:hypothetical protein